MTVQFKYDHNGLRTQKIVTENGVTTTTDYTLHGKLLTHMTSGVDTLHFFYDAQSRPAKVKYNGTMYTYVHNLQGDIVGILDSTGALVVEYRYDAWGKAISVTGTLKTTLGAINPFRYRGYVYDEETRLFYLRKRFYNATAQRFINADNERILNGFIGEYLSCNQYHYCKNVAPISVDEDGNWLNILIGAIAGAFISAGCQILSNIATGKDWDEGVVVSAASGAITGAVAASGVGLAGQIVVGAAVGAGAEFAQQMIDNNGDIDPLNCLVDCACAAAIGATSSAICGKGLLNEKGNVYKSGTRLLNVMNNAEKGMYRSPSKAISRLTKVGAQYAAEYTKESLITVSKYTVTTGIATAIKPIIKRPCKKADSIGSNQVILIPMARLVVS